MANEIEAGNNVNASPASVARTHFFQSNSLAEACDFISNIFCPHHLERLGSKIKPNIVVHHAPMIDLSVNFLSHGSRVKISPEPFKCFYLLQAPIVGSAIVMRGNRKLEIRTGMATISAPDEEIWMDWSGDCKKIILRIDRTALEKMYGLIVGGFPTGPLRFEDVISLEHGPMQSIWRMIKMIADDLLENEGSIFQNEFAIQHMEQSILYALLNSGLFPQQHTRSQLMTEIAPHQIRVVEEYIHAHVADPITIGQLVDVAGISARTLFDNFKKFRGVTPMRYIKDLRMQCVRERLVNPKAGDSVTSVAMSWGFAQLGRFAAVYKQEYGESPSQTLKRTQGDTHTKIEV